MAILRGVAGQNVSGKGVSKGKSKRASKCKDNKTPANGKGCKGAIAKKPAAKDTADMCDGNIKGKAFILKKPEAQKTMEKRSGRDKGKAVAFKKPAAKDTDKKALVLMEDGFRNFKYILM